MFQNFTKFAGAMGLAAAIVAGPVAAQDTATLRFSSAFSPMSANNRISVPAFIEAVEKASEGTLKIEHYPGGSLGKSPVQQLSMVENGITDIAEVVVAYTPGRFPELSVFELPFLAESNVEAGLAAYSMYEKGLLSDFDDLMLVGIIMTGPYALSSTDPIASMDDLAGKRLRVAGPIQTEMASLMGATPVGNVPAPQIAENISRGLLEGAMMAPGNLYNFRIADAAKHHMWDLKLGSVAVIFPMRRDTYENLPPKAKEAFDTYSGAWFTRVLGEGLDTQQEEAKAKIAADPEQTVHEWTDEQVEEARALLQPVVDEWNQPNENGVNLYEEAVSALEAVRAQN
ncbi:TRAP transporter substrate-binding protein [Cribrihabitans sp. XS_ASV171]